MLWGATPLKTEIIREIEKLISSEMSSQRIPGMSVALALDGEIWTNGYGMADLENFVPAKASTVYRTASVAKPITGVAAMQLVERDKLDLDAPVQKYVPWFPEKPWPVTTRLLLGHVGGIRGYRDDTEAFNTRHYFTLKDAVKSFADDPLAAEPGTRYLYSTFGYVLAGLVLEQASGLPYAELTRQMIYERAGMKETRVDDIYTVIPNRARGYARTPSGEVVNAALSDTSMKIPGGGLVSTAGDLVRFAIALDRGRLLKPESVAELFQPMTLRSGSSTGYGLGWGTSRVAGRKAAGHNGGQAGVSTYLRYFPDEHVAISLMFNLELVRMAELGEAIAAIAFTQ
jgi:CubicO group peptidase (beta-lactamase class C family)